jgi:hypothetical protein
MTSLLAAVATLLLCGALVDRAWFTGTGHGLPERCGRALLWGLVCVGGLSMLLDSAGLGVQRSTLGPAIAALCVLAVVLRRKEAAADPPPSRLDPQNPWLSRALLGAALLLLAVVVRSAILRPTYQFDALTRWMFKAKVLAVDHELLRGSVCSDAFFAFTHQKYPPLVSHIAQLPSLFSGEFDDRLASALLPLFAIALVLIAYGFVQRHAGRRLGALVSLWIASLPLICSIDQEPPGAGAFSAMADLPLSLFLTAATLAAAEAANGSSRALLQAGLLLSAAALTKNEGLPTLVLLPFALLCCSQQSRLKNATFLLLLGLAGYLLAWGLPSFSLPALDENYPARLTTGALLEGLPRLPVVLASLGKEMLSLRNWNLTWPVLLALVVLAGRSAFSRPSALLWLTVAAQLLSYGLAYVITGWTNPFVHSEEDPVERLLLLTQGRLLLHVAPLAIIAAVLPLRPRAAPR